MQMNSPRFTLLTEDKQKWLKNQLEFAKPLILFVAVLYFPQVIASLQTPGHIVALTDFVPSPEVITAVVLYITNAAYDLLRKWAGQHVIVK